MRLEVMSEIFDGMFFQVVNHAVHRTRLDHVVTVFLAELEVALQAGFFEGRCFIHTKSHDNLLLFCFILLTLGYLLFMALL